MPTALQDQPQINAIVRGVTRQTERTVRAITFDVVANLIEVTPVDTGWARANWVPRVGAPARAAVGTPGASGVQAAGAAQSAGQAQVLQYRLAQGSVHVTNNVPYIEALNDGSSSQEPAGFVQRAIRRALDRIARTA